MKLSKKSDGVWTSQQDEDLRRLLATGRSVNEIALRWKRSPLAVRTRMKMLGIRETEADRRADQPQVQCGPIGVCVQHGPKLPPL